MKQLQNHCQADVSKLVPKILKWEGGAKYTNDPIDKGGPTKYGRLGSMQDMIKMEMAILIAKTLNC